MKVSTDAVVLGAWANAEGASHVLDIGTGTGVLALMIAQRNPNARIDGVEIEAAAAEQARENVQASTWNERMRVHNLDVRRVVASERYDFIICNPPYYEGEMKASDAKSSLAKHSDELSFEELAAMVNKLLSKEAGRFAVIIPISREAALTSVVVENRMHLQRRCVLVHMEGRPAKRVLLEFTRAPSTVEGTELVVESGPGSYTAEYRKLLAPFMLHF